MSNSAKKPQSRKGTVLGLVCLSSLLAFIFGLLIAFIFFKARPSQEPAAETSIDAVVEPKEPETPQEIAPLQVSPTRTHGETVTAIRTLSKGFEFKSNVLFEEGGLASAERITEESYLAEYSLSINEPKPAVSLPEILTAAPKLESALPGLGTILETATVNPYWHELYSRKKKTVVNDAHYLNKIITKHNFYDCQTMLNLRHPETKRRALLVQADMDVVTDGSDGDRMPTMAEEITTSTYYQPTTSYSWAKVTDKPNPMIAGYEKRIENADRELADSSTNSERKTWLKERKTMLKNGIAEMQKRSYLIAEHDPFIVLPVPVIVAKDTYSPNVGDYAIVFYEGKAYPAIVGDAGPTYKMGEASLRIAKQLNPRAGSNWRPVSDLSVTYLVFPGTRKQPNQAPDYEDIHSQCQRLVDEIGGLGEGVSLHEWENLFPAEETEEVAPLEEVTPED